jgi:hypothetical protein
MTKRKVISIIGMVIMLFLIGNLFIPFISGGGISFSLWEYLDELDMLEVAIVMIFLLTVGFLTFLCQLCGLIDQCKFVYFPLGYYVVYHVVLFINAISNDALGSLEFGYWLGLGFGLLAFLLVFISGFLKNVKKVKRVPIRYDTKTGEPIYE